MSAFAVYDVRCQKGDSAFLLDDGKTSILYDTGFAFTGYAVADNVKKILGERTLDYIFLTHSHYDHAAGSAYIKKRFPEAKVVAGEYAAKIFAKESAKNVMRDLDRKFAEKCGVFEYDDLFDKLSVDIPVTDGSEMLAGDHKFKVISLPGHTKCSVGYFLEEDGLLLSSETLGVYVGTGVVVPSYLVGYGLTMDSFEKAKKLNIKSILSPHYGLLDEAQAKGYLDTCEKSARTTAQEILRILKNGGSDKDAFAYFKETFYHGYVKEIYPVDAMELNTSIMVKLIEKELMC